MKMSFVPKRDYTQKQESWVCLKNATMHMIQIQDMFENGKPDIVLKTVKGFKIKSIPFIILISENSFKLGNVVLVIWAGILKTQSFNLCSFLTLSVRNGVSFGTNVSCSYKMLLNKIN